MTKPKETEEPPKLKFKITNMESQIYPGKLTETDYFGFKVGDLVSHLFGSVLIYEVVDIYRDTISSSELAAWRNRVANYYYDPKTQETTIKQIKDKKAFDLLAEYEKNGNFGVCTLKLKVVLRGNKVPVRTNIKVFKEIG